MRISGRLSLADPGRPFDQHRLLQMVGHEQGGGDAARGDIANLGQALDDGLDGGQGGGTEGLGLRGIQSGQRLKLSK